MRKSLVIGGVALAVLFAGAAAYRHFVLFAPLKHQVLESLKDPDSAQFRGVSIASNWAPGKASMCGQLNAKNSMGGYVGYRWFTSGPDGVRIEDDFMQQLNDRAGIDRCKVPDGIPWWWITS